MSKLRWFQTHGRKLDIGACFFKLIFSVNSEVESNVEIMTSSDLDIQIFEKFTPKAST